MSDSPTDHDGLLLTGLDGSNPLAFLAALGTLRMLSAAYPDLKVRMNWTITGGRWCPRIESDVALPKCWECCQTLANQLHYGTADVDPMAVRHRLRSVRGARALERMQSRWKRNKCSEQQGKQNKQTITDAIKASRQRWLESCHPYLAIAKNTNLSARDFRKHLRTAATSGEARRWVQDQFAALGSDLPAEDGTMLDTALRTMSGSGHQHQLEFMANLLEHVKPKALHRALFETWDYGDPVRGLTLRLDPIDDSRYALQWENPSTDSTREECGSMMGANALAVLGFSCMPTVPVGDSLNTIGFTGRSSRDTFWTWPLWSHPISCSVACALLSHPSLFNKNRDAKALHRIGVAIIYSSQRLTVGKYRNFTPARAVMT